MHFAKVVTQFLTSPSFEDRRQSHVERLKEHVPMGERDLEGCLRNGGTTGREPGQSDNYDFLEAVRIVAPARGGILRFRRLTGAHFFAVRNHSLSCDDPASNCIFRLISLDGRVEGPLSIRRGGYRLEEGELRALTFNLILFRPFQRRRLNQTLTRSFYVLE